MVRSLGDRPFQLRVRLEGALVQLPELLALPGRQELVPLHPRRAAPGGRRAEETWA